MTSTGGSDEDVEARLMQESAGGFLHAETNLEVKIHLPANENVTI